MVTRSLGPDGGFENYSLEMQQCLKQLKQYGAISEKLGASDFESVSSGVGDLFLISVHPEP